MLCVCDYLFTYMSFCEYIYIQLFVVCTFPVCNELHYYVVHSAPNTQRTSRYANNSNQMKGIFFVDVNIRGNVHFEHFEHCAEIPIPSRADGSANCQFSISNMMDYNLNVRNFMSCVACAFFLKKNVFILFL